MGNILRVWDCGTNGALRCDASLGESIVSRVKVFAILLDFHENILVRRELSVEPEQLLLLLAHRLNIDLVPLGWMHRGAWSNAGVKGIVVGTTNEGQG